MMKEAKARFAISQETKIKLKKNTIPDKHKIDQDTTFLRIRTRKTMEPSDELVQ